ncbi:MAG: hypothetical protein FWE06_08495 [Oscillospiraceae bacterium]|nr:hypothetical protein [Oscillospiraceae bacterium]
MKHFDENSIKKAAELHDCVTPPSAEVMLAKVADAPAGKKLILFPQRAVKRTLRVASVALAASLVFIVAAMAFNQFFPGNNGNVLPPPSIGTPPPTPQHDPVGALEAYYYFMLDWLNEHGQPVNEEEAWTQQHIRHAQLIDFNNDGVYELLVITFDPETSPVLTATVWGYWDDLTGAGNQMQAIHTTEVWASGDDSMMLELAETVDGQTLLVHVKNGTYERVRDFNSLVGFEGPLYMGSDVDLLEMVFHQDLFLGAALIMQANAPPFWSYTGSYGGQPPQEISQETYENFPAEHLGIVNIYEVDLTVVDVPAFITKIEARIVILGGEVLEPTATPAPADAAAVGVRLHEADDLLPFGPRHEFIEFDEPGYPLILITTSQSLIDFRFVELSWRDASDAFYGDDHAEFLDATILWSVDELTYDTPLLVTWRDRPEKRAHRGIIFRIPNDDPFRPYRDIFYSITRDSDGTLTLVEEEDSGTIAIFSKRTQVAGVLEPATSTFQSISVTVTEQFMHLEEGAVMPPMVSYNAARAFEILSIVPATEVLHPFHYERINAPGTLFSIDILYVDGSNQRVYVSWATPTIFRYTGTYGSSGDGGYVSAAAPELLEMIGRYFGLPHDWMIRYA